MKNILLILALFVVGCATMNYSPQNIAEKSFSDLCFSLQTGYDFPTFKALNQNSMDIVWEEIKKNKNRCDKGMYPGLTRAKIKSLNEQYEKIYLIKDNEINKLTEAALKRPNNYMPWIAGGSFIAGVGTTILVFMLVK